MAPDDTSRRRTSFSTRERILLATLRLVADEGVDAVTHRAVAARAGVSPGSTTHHFASREDLLRESFRFYMDHADVLIRELMERAVDRSVDPLERLHGILSGIIEREFADGLVRAEYELLLFAGTDADLAPDARTWEARFVTALAETLESAGVGKPISAARTLLNLLRGYELERLLNPQLTLADFEERLAPFLRSLQPTT